MIRLRLQAPALVGGTRRALSASAGLHASRFRGRGIDFQESRNYQPGDDIRNMDWRVTARTGRPHTKLYREERERPVILLIDTGPTLFFGTRVAFKSVIAARAAALIGWAAVAAGDRVGASFFGAGPHGELRPLGGRRGALGLIRILADRLQPGDRPEPLPGDGLGAALGRVRRVARPG
ncbi:MAG: DUF58 domain-containing protein, partial [Candidatus Competibacteraceae bacterium]|nr:DUF58 domain-containing protein [Candidatus Competibacteraceae bacterium]